MDFFQHFQSWNSPFLGLSSRHQGIPLLILSEGYVPISIAEDFEGPPMLVHTQINLKVGRLTKTALNLATPSFSIWESTSSLVIYAWWSPTNFLVWMRNSSSLSFGSWPVLKAALWNRIGGALGWESARTSGTMPIWGGQKAAASQLKLTSNKQQMRNYSPNLHVSLKQHL